MSHDGSSCRSYIKHPTEKERLDNLAFTSFPEDYLPYTSAYHQGGRGGKAPPYLVWEERRGARRRRGRGRRGCCSTTALVSAIALIIAAILAVVAISIYLGVVTNLFRSPVLSFSGKFRVVEGDDFSEALLNVTSYQFLSKAETYQAMVENVFLSSSLEPAFIATRIYSFRPGHRLLVFFRVYLDRRKLFQSDEDTLILIQELMRQQAERKIPAFNALVLEPESIQLTENEDWLSVPLLDQRPETIEITSPVRPSTSVPSDPAKTMSTSDVTSSSSPKPSQPPTKALKSLPSTPALKRKTTAAPTPDVSPVAVASTKLPPPQYVPVDDLPDTGTGHVIAVGPINPEDDTLHYNYGQWRPVQVDGSVSPSFKDQRTPPGRGSVRLLDDPSPPNKNNDHAPMTGVGSVRVLEDPMSHVDPPIPMQRPRPVLSMDAGSVQKGTPGGVASSIMSSVSLMIMPSKNRTLPNDAEGVGSVQVVPHVMLEKDSSDRFGDRKEHASYRILTDVKDSSLGESETEETLFPETVARETDSALTEDAVFKESEVEYADNQSDNRFESNPSRVTAPTVLVESKPNNSNPSRPRESKVDHAEVKFRESKVEYADNDDASTDQENPEEKLRESKVEYEERIQESNVEYVDHASIVSNSKVEYATNDNLNESKIEYSDNEDDFQDSRDKVQQTFVKVSQTNSIEENIMTTDSSQTDFREMQSTKGSQSSIEDNKNIILDISVPLPVSVMFPPVEEFKFPSEEMSTATPGLNTEQAGRTDSTLYISTPTISELTEDKKPSSAINDELENIPLLLSEIEIDLKRLKPLHSTTVRSSYDDSLTTKETELEENLSGAYEDEDGQDDYFSTLATADLEEVSHGNSEDVTSSNFENIFSTSANDFENASMLDSSFNSSPGFLITDESFLMDEETLPENESVRIVNRSQYPTVDTKYHTIQREDQNRTHQDVFHGHTGVGHGFHDPKKEATRDMVHATTSPIGISEDDTRASASTGSDVVGSGVPKIVPQFVDRHSNDIDSDTIFNGLDEGFLNRDRVTDLPSSSFDEGSREDDVIRHVTTVLPAAENVSSLVSVEKHPNFLTPICSEEEMLCDSGECVPTSHRCNMRRDCRDNSDERNCSCAEKLKVMGQSQKICDGVQDCRDQTDENNCPWCGADQFICPQTKLCVNRSQVCDGINDCPRGADERYCVKLAENASAANGLHYYSEGYLMVRKEGRWGKLCTDNLHDTADLKVKIDELGKAVCSTLTYKELVQAERFKDTQRETEDYYKISPNKPPRQKRRSSAIFYPSECPSKDVLRVKCGSLECGVRPLGSGSRRRIVGGDSADSGSWPWQAALYKEGDFQCGAVLVSDRWLVSAGHCFFSTQTAHWTARLGLLRRGSELASPSEEIRKIVRIILHPDYIDKGFINDISLLRLDSPVPFSDYLRPLCFPAKHEEASLWHGRQCSVVGWGKLFEIGHTFPDSLQEVRLPVISTEECRKRIIFLTMYHITDNMFCAGFERGGRDACLGDSGGPLMCQRTDGRWILLGVTSNGDGCGRPGRPGVYTKVTRYLSWLQQVMGADAPMQTIPDACEGVRCPLGRCVPPYKMCDGRWDCSDGSDEEHCFT